MTDHYQLALDSLAVAVAEQLTYVPAASRFAFYELLVKLRVDTRMFYMSQELAQLTIWPMIRTDPDLLDTLVNITSDWHSRYMSQTNTQSVPTDMGLVGYQFLCYLLARGISGVSLGSLAKGKVTDDEFTSKIVDERLLAALFEEESWLVVVVLLTRHLGQFETLVTGVPKPPEGDAKNA